MGPLSADSPRVLCIAGSPRSRGNSSALLDHCIEGIRAEGGEVDLLTLATDPVSGCTGCNLCAPTGACVLHDPMTAVYPRLDAADAIVVATPVYFAGVPAGLKALFDRCQPYWARRYVLRQPPRLPRRPGALLLVRGGGDPFGPDCAIATTRSVFAVLETEMTGFVDLEGPDGPGEIEGYPDELTRVREIGADIVREARVRCLG